MYDTLAPLFDDLFGSHDTDGPVSIYEHVLVHLDPSGIGLLPEGKVLPDDQLYERQGGLGLSFAPGAREAVLAYHGDKVQNPDAVKAILAASLAFGETPSLETLRAFYTVLRRDEMVSVIDDILTGLSEFSDSAITEILRACLAFMYKAPDRGPVKFALAVLGQTDEDNLIEDFKVLSRHEEFTVYAAVAVEKIIDEPLPLLFDMAKSVTGWGRIELIQRLSGWGKPEYREWLLTEGFRNTVLDEYLAYSAATEGKLLEALRDKPTPDYVEAACDIITALIRGGPARDMTDYEDGAAVVELYLDALMGHEISIRQFVSLFEIQDFLSDIDVNWDTRMAYGWTPHRREAMLERLTALLRRTDVLPLVQVALFSDDSATFETALQAADLLDLDVWDVVYQRVKRQPDKAILWYDAARRMTGENVDNLITLARDHMDTGQLSTGPGMETGIGSEFGPHDALMFVVQELSRFPGKGWDLVKACLFSPMVPGRWTAVRTLDMWSHVWWSDDVTEAIEYLLAKEVVDDLKDHIEQLVEKHLIKHD